MNRLVVIMVLLMCSACGNSQKDSIIDSFNNVKVSQKLPNDIAESAKKKVQADTVSYVVDLAAGNEVFFGKKISTVNYTVKDGKVEAIYLTIALTSQDTDEEILKDMISRFGDPNYHCKSFVASQSNPNMFLGMDAFRWRQGTKVLQLSLMELPNNKAHISIGMKTENSTNATDKENGVDCVAFVRPELPAKNEIGLWRAVRAK